MRCTLIAILRITVLLITVLLITVLLSTVTLPASLAADDSNTTFPTDKINESFYVVRGGNGAGANVGVRLSDQGVILVDSMRAVSHERLMATLRQLTDQPVRYVLNTHDDEDHTNGNALFADQGAIVVAQDNARFSDAFHDLTFDQQMRLRFAGEAIELHHVVSHSFSDSLIFFPLSNVLLMGDTFTNIWLPTFYSGGMRGQFEAIDLALSLADDRTVVVPGHGHLSDRQGLLDYRHQAGLWLERVRDLHLEAMKVDDMTKDSQLIAIRDFFTADRDEPMPPEIFHKLIRRTISTELVAPSPASASELAEVAGTYRFEDGGIVTVEVSNGRLITREEGRFIVQLLPLSARRFYLRAWLGDEAHFEHDAEGQVIAMQVISSDGTQRGERIVD